MSEFVKVTLSQMCVASMLHRFNVGALYQYVASPLHHFNVVLLHHCIASPLRRFTIASDHQCIASPLHRITTASLQRHAVSSTTDPINLMKEIETSMSFKNDLLLPVWTS
jgi:hypothetical protein